MTHGEYSGVREDVIKLLGADTSGHSIDHVDRVHRLSLKLAHQEGANPIATGLIALLHDIDDYKLFGSESAENLTNAREVLDRHKIGGDLARQVLRTIPLMGYNNYLEGKRPDTLEGAVVSDADMCDAVGSQGLIRVFQYNASKGRPFFNKDIPPLDGSLTAEAYRASVNAHAAQHFFDKLLLIPSILMTEAGRREGDARARIMYDFLEELFREEGSEEWLMYLRAFKAQQ